MRVVVSTCLDPVVEDLLFFFGELFVALGWRHDLVLVIGIDELDEQTFLGFSGNEGLAFDGCLADVEAEVFFARLWIRSMTKEAFVRGESGPMDILEAKRLIPPPK